MEGWLGGPQPITKAQIAMPQARREIRPACGVHLIFNANPQRRSLPVATENLATLGGDGRPPGVGIDALRKETDAVVTQTDGKSPGVVADGKAVIALTVERHHLEFRGGTL